MAKRDLRSVRVLSIERSGDTYVARGAAGIVWTAELRLDMRGTPFREEILWPAASVVAIGGGNAVHFLSAESGAVMSTRSLDDDLFGEFGPADGEVLCILGWRNVVAIEQTLAMRWTSKDVAVDGISWKGQHGARIHLSAEMDPPGGWVHVELDAITGREVAREPRR